MNRHEANNAANTIDGYFLHNAHEEAKGDLFGAFIRAKKEAVETMSMAVKNVETLDYCTFLEIQNRRARLCN